MNTHPIDSKILDLCIRVNGMRAYYPQYNKVSDSILDPTPDMIGKYGWNNGKVSFVTPNGDYYVTPYCVEVADYLNKHGYENAYIYVPFSNGDEPSNLVQAMHWKRLCVAARQLHNEKEKERRRENIKSIAESKGIKKLPNEVLELSIVLPDEGLETHHLYGDGVARPVHESELKDFIGTYYQNNGRLVFVDDLGRTLVTPYCHEVREQLNAIGYKQASMYVPLSNGEEIKDPNYRSIWEKLCLGARETTLKRMAEAKKARIAEIAKRKNITPLPKELYRLVFEIYENGVETVWFGEKHDITYPVDEFNLETHIGTYCQNNGRVVFVDGHGKTFVTPFCSEIRTFLQNAGYKEGSMFVPFSNGEVPANAVFALRWKQLCSLANKEFEKREEQRRIERLSDLARRKGLRDLNPEVYSLSMKIPKDGFEVIFFESEKDTVRPVRDFELDRALGTYYQNNGRVVFVDNHGDTYVSPHCQEVSEMLSNAGYSVSSLYVPLSNGERIIDPNIAEQWNSLCARLPEVGSGPKM